ncbi:GDP-mannose 4,6-dehydratase [bacterium]|nr:GDP-mannose 4,6-dehydratase [bacterium]
MKPVSIVTGGAGFIGSHLVDLLLKENHEVRVIDNLSGGHEINLDHNKTNSSLKCEWKDINLLNQDSKIFSGAQYCFHLAGIGDIVPSIENPKNYMETNVQGTVKVLEACRHNQLKKMVYAASSSCYGLAHTPTSEEHEINPQYPYALSKYLGEQSVFHWSKVYNLPVNSICIFNAYGTRVRTTGVYGAVFGVFLKQKLENKPYTIVGDGSQKRDFVYVTDVAQGFYKAATTKLIGERFNLGGGNPQTINYLIELLKGEVVYLPKRPGEPDITFADIKKIQQQLNWYPVINFEDGVELMMSEIQRWKDAPLWDVDSISKATKTWFQYMSN